LSLEAWLHLCNLVTLYHMRDRVQI
jgi:hypothetical protein